MPSSLQASWVLPPPHDPVRVKTASTVSERVVPGAPLAQVLKL
jgi:hypothetical protein